MSEEEIRARKYHGLRESEAHKRIKRLIERSLRADPSFDTETIVQEKRWNAAGDLNTWTLFRTLMGFIPAGTGAIRFCGQDISLLATHRRALGGIGYVPQGRQIFPQLSVIENLRMGVLGRSGTEVERILAQFPRLTRLLDRAGGTLSGGEQQLLAIARALCGSPKLLLLDEPTEGIQPSIVEEISELLQQLNRKLWLAIVVVEQDLDFVASVASSVALMQRGVITQRVDVKAMADAGFVDEFPGLTQQ
ncbi:ABC transporter ATP-binding protein [Bradyrhizobium liaoningense]